MNKRKAIFLDRDGVINQFVEGSPCINTPEKFKLCPTAATAIGLINRTDYLAIVVTNQPGIAQGYASWEDIENVHAAMNKLLELIGVKVDDIFFCPHHPERGWPGERAEFKIPCDCRKPLPGLLLRAAEKHNIDLQNSWMIGDRIQDTIAGQMAGCKTYQINAEEDDGLLKAIEFIFNEENINI